MQNILIIRSVSYQQLDKALPVIRAAYPESRVVLLTHAHGAAQARAIPGIDDVRIYPHNAGFNWRRKARALKGESYDAVIIPVANATGAGFQNVCLFALTIKARSLVLCNVTADLIVLRRIRIWADAAKCCAFAALAVLGTIIGAAFVLPLFPLLLLRLRVSE